MIRGRPSSEPQSEVIGGATLALSPAVREQTVLQARLAAARYHICIGNKKKIKSYS